MKLETVIIRGQLIPKDGEEARQTSPMGGAGGCVCGWFQKKPKKQNQTN